MAGSVMVSENLILKTEVNVRTSSDTRYCSKPISVSIAEYTRNSRIMNLCMSPQRGSL
jgi:hypothetical protein